MIEGGTPPTKRPNDGGTVNLSDTFGMLRALAITKIDEGANTVQLGFTREEEALKALYHNEVGVGSRRVVRRFMELTLPEQREILETVVSGGFTILT